MRNEEQRIKTMHELAYKIKRKSEKAVLKALGTVSVLLFAVLIGWLYAVDGNLHQVSGNGFTGNSMLSADIGGYVLVAVISFIAAVLITILCIRYKEKNKNVKDDKENPDKT